MEFARGKLMVACFLTLVASGYGFAARTAAGGPWASEFNIGGADFGAIMGAGFLGLGLMVFFGGILVEKFGYKTLLMIAIVLHLVSAGMLFAANPMFEAWQESDPENATKNVFRVLFWSAFLFSICQGLYESVINPLIAQLYPENKTHYLNILHAGWPGGMIIGGLFAFGFIGENAWFTQLPWAVSLASFSIFVVLCALMVIPEKMPPTVSSSASSFATVFSCFWSLPFLLLIAMHAMIGYMELGVDSWMTKLMETMLDNSILILVYTSALMFILRFFAGPIVHRINPIGLLLASAVIACIGLLWLSTPMGVGMLFAAATFYSFGKAFLWPTMLAVAGERYPQCGSVAMGALGAAGMICVGQVGNPRLGAQQGYEMSRSLQADAPETFQRYADDTPQMGWEPEWWPESAPPLGPEYLPLGASKVDAAKSMREVDGTISDTSAITDTELIPESEKAGLIENATADAAAVKESYLKGGRWALNQTAWLPGMMAVGFFVLLVYYRAIGGYKVLEVEPESDP